MINAVNSIIKGLTSLSVAHESCVLVQEVCGLNPFEAVKQKNNVKIKCHWRRQTKLTTTDKS